MTENPYAAPTAPQVETMDAAKLDRIIRDHKYSISSFVVYLGAALTAGFLGIPAVTLALSVVMLIAFVVCAVFTVSLIFRLNSVVSGIVLLFCMFIPLVNLFIYVMILNDAGKKLKAHGYKVGFLGGIKDAPNRSAAVAAQ